MKGYIPVIREHLLKEIEKKSRAAANCHGERNDISYYDRAQSGA